MAQPYNRSQRLPARTVHFSAAFYIPAQQQSGQADTGGRLGGPQRAQAPQGEDEVAVQVAGGQLKGPGPQGLGVGLILSLFTLPPPPESPRWLSGRRPGALR